MWNNSGGTSVINWKIQPALSTEYFLETVMGLAADKKRRKRVNSLLQRSVMAKVFKGLSAFQAAIFCSKNSFFTVDTVCMVYRLPCIL